MDTENAILEGVICCRQDVKTNSLILLFKTLSVRVRCPNFIAFRLNITILLHNVYNVYFLSAITDAQHGKI